MKLSESNGTVKLSEAAKTVIELGAAIRDYWNTELPKRLRDYPIVAPDEDEGPPPPEEAMLREYIMGLPLEMVHELYLIMDLGRWEFDTDKLKEKYEELKARYPNRERIISSMLYHTPLPTYITRGIERLKANKINVDKLFSKNGKTRK